MLARQMFQEDNPKKTLDEANPRSGATEKMSAGPEFYLRTRKGLIRGCAIFGLIVATNVCSYPQDLPRVARELGDNTTREPTRDLPRPDQTFDASVPKKPAAAVLMQNPLGIIPLASLTATRERPLFSPTRRPPPPIVLLAPPVPVSLQQADPTPPALTLVGTIIGQKQNTGIFVDQVAKKIVRLRMGGVYSGWRLRAIGEHEATFECNQREAILTMLIAGMGGRTGTPVQARLPAAPGASWVDGDGQLISPPPAAVSGGTEKMPGPAPATWLDGDGQLISPPPAQIRKSVQN
jgi:hypothetical protein